VESHDGGELSGPDPGIERAWREGLTPDPLLTVSEWADRYRVLSQRASSEPGRWRTERTPYLRDLLDALSPSSPYRRVVLMKGAQVGGPLALDTPLPTPGGWTTMGAGPGQQGLLVIGLHGFPAGLRAGMLGLHQIVD
jgi:Phage terminase large subunit gpA, ATPase domain